MSQPNLNNVKQGTNWIPATDFDNMSDAELEAAIFASHKAKTGRGLTLPKATPIQEKRHVDIDALIKQYGGK
jgi:hypothetical protein